MSFAEDLRRCSLCCQIGDSNADVSNISHIYLNIDQEIGSSSHQCFIGI